MSKREYEVNITVNGRWIRKVIIDSHYEAKHLASVNDELILELLLLLDNGVFPVQQRSESYEYYVTDRLKLREKFYKLIWLLEDNELYIGVINAYRR